MVPVVTCCSENSIDDLEAWSSKPIKHDETHTPNNSLSLFSLVELLQPEINNIKDINTVGKTNLEKKRPYF